MKRARLFLLVLAVTSAIVLSACTAKHTSKKDDADDTTKSSESGDKGNSTDESAGTNETTPTGTDEPTPTASEAINATAKGSVFTDYNGKTVDEIVENIQKIHTIDKDDTMENYGERFDETPNTSGIEKEFTHNASYHWQSGKGGATEYVPLITIHCRTGEDDKFQLDEGSSASIMIEFKDKETAMAVYDRVCALLQEGYGEINDDGTFDPWNPIDHREDDYWETVYGARHIGLRWPSDSNDHYELYTMIDLRAATK